MLLRAFQKPGEFVVGQHELDRTGVPFFKKSMKKACGYKNLDT